MDATRDKMAENVMAAVRSAAANGRAIVYDVPKSFYAEMDEMVTLHQMYLRVVGDRGDLLRVEVRR